jgi:hypothetical protein
MISKQKNNMMMTDVIFEHWKAFKKLTQGTPQSGFFAKKIKDGHAVRCVSVYDVFTKDEIEKIKSSVRPKKHMCYKNAHVFCVLFPDRVKYVEGEVTCFNGAFGIEHAWNVVDGEHYVDLTLELVLKRDVNKKGYVALGEYDAKMLRKVTSKTGVYGDIYTHLFIDTLKRKRKDGQQNKNNYEAF